MNRKAKSRVLVVDASVARAAGETEHPISKACRDFLDAILTICHHIALNEPLKQEWGEHQSRYTRKWRGSMLRKGKVHLRAAKIQPELNLENFEEKNRTAIEKDWHLLDLALATDCEIVTLDKALPKALAAAPNGERLRRRIIWHDPVEDGVSGLQRRPKHS